MRSPILLPVLFVLLCGSSVSSAQTRTDASIANLREFGAVGDGQTDDTQALRKAIDSGRGVVQIPKGRFRVTKTLDIDLERTGYIAIEGHGVGQIVVACAGPALRFIGTHIKGSADPESFQPNVWQN
jgi:hypothetical protein